MNDDLKKASTKATKATRAKAKVTYSAHAIHLVRTAQLNTLTLSQMADQKASILMGATFLVFSLTVSRALVGEVSLAMLILAATAFISSLCAVIAVIPSISKPKDGARPSNKLFFGHFAERSGFAGAQVQIPHDCLSDFYRWPDYHDVCLSRRGGRFDRHLDGQQFLNRIHEGHDRDGF